MALKPGDTLGPYEIIAPIGKGGMGEVYRAHDSRLNRDVAIKVSNAQFTERFTRVSADKIDYRFTVNDPVTFTKPWTAELPMTRLEGQLYEYACHEGNYGMVGILSGHRAQEKTSATGVTK